MGQEENRTKEITPEKFCTYKCTSVKKSTAYNSEWVGVAVWNEMILESSLRGRVKDSIEEYIWFG
jgi:hypothetical protein